MNKKDSNYVINSLIKWFKDFYGDKLDKLIDERIINLVDIIFYNNHQVKRKLKDISDYLDEYGIDKYRKEIINKEIPISKYILETGQQGTMIYEKNEKLQMIIYFPNSTIKNYNYDCILIHELLHVLDEHIIYKNLNNIVSQGGFEKTVLKGNIKIDRDYEFLNEIIHQRISEDINEYLYNNDILIYNTKEEKKKSIDEYMIDRCKVIDLFYNRFKDKLLIDKLTGNIEDFILFVGRENFEEFNEWIINFYNTYKTPNERIKMSNSLEYKNMIKEGINIVNKM